MPSLYDIFIINSYRTNETPEPYGASRVLSNEALCGSETLDVFHRTVTPGATLPVEAAEAYHALYIMASSGDGRIIFEDDSLPASPGARELLTPGEAAAFEAVESALDILHMVTPNPPPEIENGLPGGSGYLFSRDTLRSLTDASGGRRRRFCAESSIR